MILSRTIADVKQILAAERRSGKRIGVVPTMGALHEGHLSLVRVIRPQCDHVVLWLFLNPTQFNSKADYDKYPRTLERDAALAKEAGVDLVFAPSVEEIYPDGLEAYYEKRSVRTYAGACSWGLCGAKRPGHFDGVVHIVAVLFNILQPDVAVFGEKDYQQLRVIEQLVRDMHYHIEIIAAPLIRAESGIALSSRNELLQKDSTAPLALSRALLSARDAAEQGETDAASIRELAAGIIRTAGLSIDYVEVTDIHTLAPVAEIRNEAQLLVAAYCGEVRLIDNIRLRTSGYNPSALKTNG